MATIQHSVFPKSQTMCQRLGRLVQDRLSTFEAEQTGCRPDIDDLISMIDILTATATTCTSVLLDVHAQGQQTDPCAVLKGIENAVTWHSCLSC